MVRVSMITNTNKLLEQKINYFADCFKFFNAYIGVLPGFEVETHVSILKKIEFQLLNNKPDKTLKYINYYLSKDLISENDLIISEFYREEWKSFAGFRKGVDGKTDLNLLVKEVRRLIQLLEKDFFRKYVDRTCTFITCVHPLSEHKQHFDYISRIIVSAYILKGFSRKDIEAVFSRILAQSYEEHEEGIYTRFPVNQDLHEVFRKYRKGEETREALVKELDAFFKNRTFKEQFLGIYNLFSYEDHVFTFLFRVENVRVNAGYTLTYKSVEFVKASDFAEKYKDRIDDYNSDFFKEKDNALTAIVNASARSMDIAVSRAVEELEEAIDFLNWALEANGFLDRKEYIPFEEEEEYKFFCNSLTRRNYFYEPYAKEADKLNLYLIFKDRQDNPPIEKLLHSEKLFLSIINSKSNDERTLTSWTFLDSFIDFSIDALKSMLSYGKNCRKSDGELISELFAKVLLFDNKYHVRDRLHYFIHNVVLNCRYAGGESIKISNEQYNELMKNENFELVNIGSLKRMISHDFFKGKIKSLETYGKTHHTEIAFKYYSGVLSELYESRNMLSHSGKSLPVSAIKLNYAIPPLIKRIKQTIVEELIKNSYNSNEELFKKLIQSTKD